MRDEEGEGDPHRGPIDLDGGTVQIRIAAAPDVSAEAGGATDTPKPKPDGAGESDASEALAVPQTRDALGGSAE